jgi:D-xylose transport system permease protein
MAIAPETGAGPAGSSSSPAGSSPSQGAGATRPGAGNLSSAASQRLLGVGASSGAAALGDYTEAAPADEAAAALALAVAAEVVANDLRSYLRAWWQRVRGGDSGVLPVVVGLAVIVVVFEIRTSLYLSAGNIVNLLNQAVVFVLFAIGEVFVLLLGEIDLSMVFNAGIGAGMVAAFVVHPYDFPWWLAILCGLAGTTIIGLGLGALITRLRLPSFIVTLAAYIGLQGVMLWMFDTLPIAVGGVISISNRVILDFVNGSLSRTASWVAMALAVVLFGGATVFRDVRRRAAGLVTPPIGLTLLKVGTVAVAGVVLVWVCNINRGTGATKVWGVPWSIPIVLVLYSGATFLLSRTRFGRYIYAIGGNAEAARRAGINVQLVRTLGFLISGLFAGLAGVMYLSQIGSIATDIDPSYVLFAVAAAVIGGTSLFGGRGKPLHAVLGGLVIAAVYNGIYLIGFGAAATDMVTGIVLLVAVAVDSVARRGSQRVT